MTLSPQFNMWLSLSVYIRTTRTDNLQVHSLVTFFRVLGNNENMHEDNA